MILSLIFLFSCLQLADGYTTYRILSTGGRELNPVMRWAMEKIGMIQGLAVMKLVLIGIVVAAYNEVLTFWLCALYTLVVGWNTYNLLKDKNGI